MKNPPQFMSLMRELVRAYQAFASYDATLLRERNLTAPQADILFALGNTKGMTFRMLGEKTLITKGTLTGIIDRMATKDLLKRIPSEDDGRSMVVMLTTKGDRLFQKVFPEHIADLKKRFDALSIEEMRQAEVMLRKIKELF